MSVNIKTQSGLKRFAGNTISTTATPLMSGLMSAEDKQKLDSVGDVGVVYDRLGWSSSRRVILPSDTIFQYDFIYVACGDDYWESGKSLMSEDLVILPIQIFKDYYQQTTDSFYFDSNMYVAYEEESDGFEFYVRNTNLSYCEVNGIKIKGSTASGGGKVLAFETDTNASSYKIKGTDENASPIHIQLLTGDSGQSLFDLCEYVGYVTPTKPLKCLPIHPPFQAQEVLFLLVVRR